MRRIELQAKVRETGGTGAARALRRDGYTPAVIYGPDTETVPIAVGTKDIESIIRDGGSSALITLGVEGAKKGEEPPLTIIKDTQYHPMGDPLLHVDFYKVTLGKELQVTIPVVLVGEPKGAEEGGSVDHVMREADISCTPRKIPDQLEVDISHMDIGDSIAFGDVELPDGVTVLHDPEITIASVKIARIELEIVEEEPEEGEEVEGEEGEEVEGEEGEETAEGEDEASGEDESEK
jgi:large subunit ribosomal protein L25